LVDREKVTELNQQSPVCIAGSLQFCNVFASLQQRYS
jgi:hypothetical protein